MGQMPSRTDNTRLTDDQDASVVNSWTKLILPFFTGSLRLFIFEIALYFLIFQGLHHLLTRSSQMKMRSAQDPTKQADAGAPSVVLNNTIRDGMNLLRRNLRRSS
ncbi:unnamed protein product [Amoebophrya sp. A25]|nr:unnamed protein product [Amoebophrya sp. A25]|eukprot:GSA25T00018383001.1